MNRLFFLIVMMTSSLLLSACWDRYELEDRANILGIAIDVVDEETKNFTLPEITYKESGYPGGDGEPLYKLTAQLAVPGKIKLGPEGGGGQGSDKTAWVLETVGHSMKDAMMNLQQQLAERLYLGHLQIIVVNKDIAKEGITDINDYLKREYEVRRTAWMVITEEKAGDVLQVAPPIETVPSLYLADTLEHAMRFGKLPREYMGKFWVDLSDIGIDGVMPLVKVIEGDRIIVNGLAYFKGDKLKGNMSPFDTGAFLAMKGKSPGGYTIAASTDTGVYLIESTRRKSNIKVNVKNGQPNALIDVEITGAIEEQTKGGRLTNAELEEIEKEASQLVTEKFNEIVGSWREDESDILGIGARIRAKFPKYWDQEVKTADNWAAIYKVMHIQVNVVITIERTGMGWK